MWIPDFRCIHDSAEHEVRGILHEGGMRADIQQRWSPLRLDPSFRVHFPTDFTGGTETTMTTGQGYSCDSVVAKTNNTSTITESVPSIPGKEGSSRPPNCEWNPASTSRCPFLFSHGMEHRTITLSEKARVTLDNSHKPEILPF